MPAKLSSGHRTGKDQFSCQSQRRAMPMNVQTTAQLPLILHANKVILKSFNPGFNNTWTKNFKMYKLVLEKAEELEIKLPLLLRSQKKLENSRKTKISFCFIGYSKDFDCVDNNKADNSTRDGNQFRSVQFSRSVVFDSLQPHELQHTRPPCPSPTPGVYSNSCPSSQWCHPTISSSVAPFSSCPPSFPATSSFPMSQSSHQLAQILELQRQHQSFQWIFRTDLL